MKTEEAELITHYREYLKTLSYAELLDEYGKDKESELEDACFSELAKRNTK